MKGFIKNKIRTIISENVDNIKLYKEWINSNKVRIKINKISSFFNVGVNLNSFNPEEFAKNKENLNKLRPIINDFINTKINQNECFHNAAKTFEFFNKMGYDVSFVLGMMIEGDKKFGHAWNKIDGKYYDLTADKNETDLPNQYYKIVELNDIVSITSLDVFNPNYDCKHKLTIEGENYDKNGMCSLYPYFMSINPNR
jgi:hypothetical protein